MRPRILPTLLLFALIATLAPAGFAEKIPDDVGMYGGTPSRNMVSDETGLPSEWDLSSGKNVKWRQKLGSQSYGGPVIAGGKVYAGTNNEAARDPEITGDKGNVMVFDEETGEFLWQAVHDKLPTGRVHDWPLQGVCSAPYVEGDRLYYVSNQAELIASDTEGFMDGENDGPITSEQRTTKAHEDILWKLDMIDELDVFPHNLAVGSPVIADDLIFTVTGNGVDEGHITIPAPLAPSFIAVNKNTGELVWENAAPGTKILHGSWSNPAYGVIDGVAQVVFPGGDGWMYSFEPKTGKELWRFDCNPKDSEWSLGGMGSRNNIVSTPVIHNDRVYIAVGQDPEHGEGIGHFYAIDATKRGDITETGAHFHISEGDFGDSDAFHRTISTAAIADGIVYIADLSGFLYAFDAETGDHYWTYDLFAAVWGSAYVADGKVYIGDEDGDITVLKAGKGKDGQAELIAEMNVGSSVYTTPVARNGVLYVMSRNTLFALAEGAQESSP